MELAENLWLFFLICVCVCVCVRVREGEIVRERERERARLESISRRLNIFQQISNKLFSSISGTPV